jgi:hypothetical protein
MMRVLKWVLVVAASSALAQSSTDAPSNASASSRMKKIQKLTPRHKPKDGECVNVCSAQMSNCIEKCPLAPPQDELTEAQALKQAKNTKTEKKSAKQSAADHCADPCADQAAECYKGCK